MGIVFQPVIALNPARSGATLAGRRVSGRSAGEVPGLLSLWAFRPSLRKS